MQYDFGLSKIYEMVVNTNPSYAFLMDMNNLLQNTFVAAHVFGHTDFFKNNAYFQHTSRRMIDKVSIHAERIAKYEFDHGKAEVERFLDAVLSIQEHVDYNLLIRENEPDKDKQKEKTVKQLTSRRGTRPVPGQTAKVSREARKGPFTISGKLLPTPYTLATRHRRDRTYRDALLRAPDANQDNERRLGQLMALAHHAQTRRTRRNLRLRSNRIRTIALWRTLTIAHLAQPVLPGLQDA